MGVKKRRERKKREKKGKDECVYQQTFGHCQLTARASGCQGERRLYNYQSIESERQGEQWVWSSENKNRQINILMDTVDTQMDKKTDTQTHKQTHTKRETDTQTHRQTDRQTKRQTDRQTHRHTDTQTDRENRGRKGKKSAAWGLSEESDNKAMGATWADCV